MWQEEKKSNQPASTPAPDKKTPNKTVEPEMPDRNDPDAKRTGPGTGAGRGNDLPSSSKTQRDTRSAEGQKPARSQDIDSVQSENPDA